MNLLFQRVDTTGDGRKLSLVRNKIAAQGADLGLERSDLVSDDLNPFFVEGIKLVIDVTLVKSEVGKLLFSRSQGGSKLRPAIVPSRR